MKVHSLKWLMAGTLMMASLAGCGGGSSSTPAAGKTVIKGTASAGIIYPGVVNVYAVDANGTKGALLAGSLPTSIDGKYTAPLGGYSGAVLVEASGTYTDEASANQVTIPATRPLHTLVDKVNETTDNNRVVSVTPLTDLAWRKASGNGTAATTPAAMVAANKLVDDLFKITDIVGIEPVRPDNASMGNASQDSQAYTLALAALSKMSQTAVGVTGNDKMETTLTSMETEIKNAETGGSMSASAAGEFAAALGTIQLSTDYPSASDQLSSMGKKSQILTLTTSGTLPALAKIYAIEGTIALPVDAVTNKLKVSLRADSAGKTLSDVFLLAGVATGLGGLDPVATYLAPQQQATFRVVLNAAGPGIGIGDFATLSYDVASGAKVTGADFSLVSGTVFVKDSNGADIAGVTVTLR